VAPNVKIGNCSVIGAGSLVLEDIPDNVFAHGRPARVIEEKTE
jgi:acetyltransferase-like isoleucine patch superfamily enzyme